VRRQQGKQAFFFDRQERFSTMVRYAIVTLAAWCLLATTTHAGFVWVFMQVGNDVIATGEGTINTSIMVLVGPFEQIANVSPASAYLALGPTTGSFENEWHGITPQFMNFGTGGPTAATSGDGDSVGISSAGVLLTPVKRQLFFPINDN
jgi:hypothetical protein